MLLSPRCDLGREPKVCSQAHSLFSKPLLCEPNNDFREKTTQPVKRLLLPRDKAGISSCPENKCSTWVLDTEGLGRRKEHGDVSTGRYQGTRHDTSTSLGFCTLSRKQSLLNANNLTPAELFRVSERPYMVDGTLAVFLET